jgi:hypothetical protein
LGSWSYRLRPRWEGLIHQLVASCTKLGDRLLIADVGRITHNWSLRFKIRQWIGYA